MSAATGHSKSNVRLYQSVQDGAVRMSVEKAYWCWIGCRGVVQQVRSEGQSHNLFLSYLYNK